jgi:hypothetical protein
VEKDSPTELEERLNKLIAEVESAFDGVSREGGITLHEAIAIDDYRSAEEQRAARRLDVEQRWQDVPSDDIFACCSALSFLCERSFRYYLAAFILCELKNFYKEGAPGVLDTCQWHLLHEQGKSQRKSEPAAIAQKYGLTGAQVRVVSQVLRFMIDFDQGATDQVTIQGVEKWERFAQEVG